MSIKKAILFIDGSNTYHRLKENGLYDFFSYKWLYKELRKKFDVISVFFYDATKSSRIEKEGYEKQQQFHEDLRKEIPGVKIRTRKLKYLKVDGKVSSARRDAEFCDVCEQKIDKFLQDAGLHKLSKEKGVDVLLVTDMIKLAFQEKYEVALLLTGDADFVPAVEILPTLKKEVGNVHLFVGSSGELRNACDSHILISCDRNNKCFLRYSS